MVCADALGHCISVAVYGKHCMACLCVWSLQGEVSLRSIKALTRVRRNVIIRIP